MKKRNLNMFEVFKIFKKLIHSVQLIASTMQTKDVTI